MNRLKDKVAIVTGAAGGIGFATARLFAQEGARVMLVDRDADRLQALTAEIGSGADWYDADVSDARSAKGFVDKTVRKFGGLDILFANAGTEGTVAPLSELPLVDFDRVLAVNVRGVFLGMQAAIPALVARGGGSIIATSSVAGLVGSAGLSAYVASKHAVVGLMRSAAIELAPMGIRVNTLNPGPIENRMMRSIEGQANPENAQAVKDGFTSMVPLGRYGTNEEMAKMALFLAGEDSSYCTGAVFVADGGFVTG